MSRVVGVVGASARAAVHSLARAGYSAWAVDLFADRDLARVAPCAVCPADEYPTALPRLARHFPAGPMLYTGGLENHPQVVAELAADRELWGNPPEVLEQVRDPWRLRDTLGIGAFAAPRVVAPGDSPPAWTRGLRWLRKPLRASGGTGIRFSNFDDEPSATHYFQEFIPGTSMSAVFVNDTLFGATEQLVGEPWLHARPFAYCGSVGSVTLSPDTRADLNLLGAVFTPAFGLRGVWNVDFILNNHRVYPVEVNPRYTASVEVLEHAAGGRVFTSPPALRGRGRRVFEPGEGEGLAHPLTPTLSPGFAGEREKDPAHGVRLDGATEPRLVAKAVYYAPHAITFPSAGPWDADLAGPFDPWRLPAFADIPAPGTVIEPGQPVLTLLVSGSSAAECRERLQLRAAELDRLFGDTP